ncbi:MAG: assimilatory sulfite reductase (NADPH) flavoprotein subunit [Lentisphaeria bacterium]|nr:assimilatory sulfite reductase (NADPH) flavoprotein subunit [Lentisphaeria bacterium]
MSNLSSLVGNPLSPEQAVQLDALISTLSSQQLAWLGGYLSALGLQGDGSPIKASAPAGSQELTILFGTQTGNSETVAEMLLAKANEAGIKATMKDIADIKPKQLKNFDHLAFIVSTHGEGDPPDSVIEAHEYISGKKAAKMEGVKYSVLALGDVSYDNYCQTGKDFDEAFARLGAASVVDRADCDVDFEDAAEEWADKVILEFKNLFESSGSVGTPVAFAASAPVKSQFNKKNPFPAEILEQVNLNDEGSLKETYHIELSLEGSGLQYEAGDALGILPTNPADLIEAIIEALPYDADTHVPVADDILELHQALKHHFEITILNKDLVKKYAALVENVDLSKLVEDNDKLTSYLDGRDVLDLIQDYPVGDLSAVDFTSLLRKLPPRLYSIASGPAANEDEVHITVGAVRYESHGRSRKGVCSGFLADDVEVGEQVPVYIHPNKNFGLPVDDDTPIIMIGPGTGIAPFRAFVQEREERDAEGKSWLFFGDQHFYSDFLYQTEWLTALKNGSLTKLDVAFSRDQEEKVYVQNRMQENAAELYKWINDEGAYLYVCGDASRMAEDVNQALIQIVASEGNMDEAAATDYVKQLQKDKRYQRDVY